MPNSTLIGIALPTMRDLRSRILSSNQSEDAVAALREAGYAGGESVYEAFEQWLAETRGPGIDAGELTLDEFGQASSKFFRDAGWGEMTFSHEDDDDVANISIAGCWEGDSAGGCHITTGVLASFFGRVAGYPVAVLETSCSVDGVCQFMIGNGEIMNHRWESMQS